VLWGDPLGDEVWFDLDALLAQEWTHETGAKLKVQATCLDTGGTKGYTQAAYGYAKGKEAKRLFAIKGASGWDRPIVEKPQRKQSGKKSRKVTLFLVGVDQAKAVVMKRLANTTPGPGYCHFPSDYDEDHFKALTAEKIVTRYVKGQPKREWTKPDKARNEQLDCRTYAFAALKIMNPNLKAHHSRLMNRVVQNVDPEVISEIPQVELKNIEVENQTLKKKPKSRKSARGWMNNF